MTQCLRALVVLGEDPGLGSQRHMAANNYLQLQFQALLVKKNVML